MSLTCDDNWLFDWNHHLWLCSVSQQRFSVLDWSVVVVVVVGDTEAESDAKQRGLRVSDRDWKSDQILLFFGRFSSDDPLHSNCLACHILAKAIRLTAGGRRGRCWVLQLRYYRSNSELWSCLIVAYCSFSKWEFLWSWNVKWSRKLKNLR